MKIDYQDRIDDYLLHRMSEKERLAFEQEINDNKELQDQLSYTKDLKAIIRNRNEKLAMMKEWEAGHKWDNRVYYWISGIAAVLIAGVFIFNTYKSTSSIGIPDVSSPKQYGDVTFRSAMNYHVLEKLLTAGDYRQALKQIEDEENDIKKQIKQLERELREERDNLEDNAEKRNILKYKLDFLLWLKVQAYLGLNRKDEAVSLLNVIRHSESDYQEQADSLYNALGE